MAGGTSTRANSIGDFAGLPGAAIRVAGALIVLRRLGEARRCERCWDVNAINHAHVVKIDGGGDLGCRSLKVVFNFSEGTARSRAVADRVTSAIAGEAGAAIRVDTLATLAQVVATIAVVAAAGPDGQASRQIATALACP